MLRHLSQLAKTTAAALCLGLMALPVQALVITYDVALTTDQSAATHMLDLGGATPSGNAAVTLETDTGPDANLLSWDITWEGLTGTANAMHFHGPADFGQMAGIQVDIFANETAGDHAATGFTMGSASINDAFATELRDGLWYINLHTTDNPAGEIRAQVVPTPMPLALLGLGLVLLALVGRTSGGNGSAA